MAIAATTVDRPQLADVVEWMRRYARKDSTSIPVRRLVEKLNSNLAQGDYASEVLAIYYWVCQNIRYTRDISDVEFVKDPIRTLETRTGDCDDISTLIASMLLACGNRVRFALVGFVEGGAPSHVFCEVKTPSGWVALDPVANRETADMLSRVKTRLERAV